MWKVTEDILQSLQVEERDKTSVYEIGKKLIIHGEVIFIYCYYYKYVWITNNYELFCQCETV